MRLFGLLIKSPSLRRPRPVRALRGVVSWAIHLETALTVSRIRQPGPGLGAEPQTVLKQVYARATTRLVGEW